MAQTPALYVRFWSQASQAGAWPTTWEVSHDGPLDATKLAAQGTMDARIFPTATRFTIHEYETDKQVYP